MVDLGLVGIVDAGEYTSEKTYKKGQFVYYVDSTYLCLVDNISGVTPVDDKINWKFLARGAGNMAYKVLTLTQNDLAATDDEITPYKYIVDWPTAKATDYSDASIVSGSYEGGFSVKSLAGSVELYFGEKIYGSLTMYVYLQGGEIAEDGSPSDAYYTKPEMDDKLAWFSVVNGKLCVNYEG